jgi:hypothetical protein
MQRKNREYRVVWGVSAVFSLVHNPTRKPAFGSDCLGSYNAMSLTGELRKKQSPVRQWFNAHLDDPGARKLTTEINDQLAPMPPIVTNGADPKLVGTAFDYGFRWLLGPMERRSAAYRGAVGYMAGDMKQAMPMLDAILNTGDATTDPKVRAQCCIVLAWFESKYRANAVAPELRDVLSSAKASAQQALDATPEPSVQDVVALLDTVPHVWGDDLRRPFTLNPSFESSRLVGAADADWITEQTLYDCKCSGQKRPFRRYELLQMLGYMLLDTNDSFMLQSAGWYYARQQKRIVYPVTALIERVFGTTNLQGLRNNFHETLSLSVC